MKRAGDILKEERIRQELTLDEIARRTKVRKEFLELIENGQYDKLPSQVYIRGFISSYATSLGLDADKVIPFYRRERKKVESSSESTNIPQPIAQQKFRLTPGKILMAIVSVALTAFLIFLFIQYRNYAGAPVLIVDSPINNSSTTDSNIEVTGKADSETEVTINGEIVPLKIDGSFQVSFSLNDGINRIRIIATSKLGKKNVIERVIDKKPSS
ncbi:helix-turn-helix domain-containing protein [candidate division WWE3 bacterium]|nr:helix-turn-helix domain-containing protein [candidate division WWE3 bacterium]